THTAGATRLAGGVTVTGVVDLAATDVPNLQTATLNAGANNVTFTTVDGPGALVVNTTGDTTFNGAVGSLSALAALTTNAGGTTFINGGAVTTTGSQAYHDDVELGSGGTTTLTVTGSGSSIVFDGNLKGDGHALVISATTALGSDFSVAGALT